MTGKRDKKLDEMRENFRNNIAAVFASVDRSRDSFTMSQFYEVFESVTKEQFPTGQSLGFSNDQDMFRSVGDICKLEISEGYVRVRKTWPEQARTLGTQGSLSQNIPGRQAARRNTVTSQSSDDDVQIIFDRNSNGTPVNHGFSNQQQQPLQQPQEPQHRQQQFGSQPFQKLPQELMLGNQNTARYPVGGFNGHQNVPMRPLAQSYGMVGFPKSVSQLQRPNSNRSSPLMPQPIRPLMGSPFDHHANLNATSIHSSSISSISNEFPLITNSALNVSNCQNSSTSPNSLNNTTSAAIPKDPSRQRLKTFREEVQFFRVEEQRRLAEEELIGLLGPQKYSSINKSRNWASLNISDYCALVDEHRNNRTVTDANLGNVDVSADLQNQQERKTRTSLSATPPRPTVSSTYTSPPLRSVGSKQGGGSALRSGNRRHMNSQGDSPEFICLNDNPSLPAAPGIGENDVIMQTVDKIERGEVMSSQAILPNSVITQPDLDTACKIILQNMCSNGEFVCAPKVEKALLHYYRKKSLADFRIGNVRHVNQIACLKELSMRERKVNLYIDIYVELRNVCTIRDLETLLVALPTHPSEATPSSSSATQKQTFESVYQMGPLYKNPVIYDKFKFPTDGSVQPQNLTSSMVASHFRDYLVKNNLWATRELQTNDFLKFLADALDVVNPWHIGIRIISLPLLKSVLSRAQADGRRETEKIANQNVELLLADMRTEITAIRCQVAASLHINTNSVFAFIQQVKLMNTAEVLKKCYNLCKPIFKYTAQSSSSEEKKKRKKFAEVCQSFENFFDICRTNPVAEALFEFSLLVSSKIGDSKVVSEAIVFVLDNQDLWLEVVRYCPKELGCELFFKDSVANGTETEVVDLVSDDEERGGSSYRNKQTIKLECATGTEKEEEAEQFLMSLLTEAKGTDANNSVSLEQLEAIEQRVLNSKFQKVLEKTTMLEFIFSNQNLQRAFSESIGNDNKAVKNIFENSCGLNLKKLREFVQKIEPESSVEQIMESLKRSFDLETEHDEDIRHQVEEMIEIPFDETDDVIPYAGSFATSVDLSSSVMEEKELTQLAWSKILEIEHLESISSKIKWSEFFRATLGSLDKFLKQNDSFFRSKNVKFLRLDDFEVVKIPFECSYEACRKSVERQNGREFSALLVSLIISTGGVKSFPFQLCQSELHASFNVLLQRNLLHEFIASAVSVLPLIYVPPIFSNLLKPVAEKVGLCDLESKMMDCVIAENNSSKLLKLAMVGNVMGEKQWVSALINESNWHDQSVDLSVENNQETDRTGFKFSLSGSFEKRSSPIAETSSVQTTEKDSADVTSITKSDKEQIELRIKLDREESCRKIVDVILNEEFGEGIEMNSEARVLLEKHQERIGRSLERLSKELYSQDVHFILELIQNADDNNYNLNVADSNLEPTLIFALDSQKLTVFNNETGFESQNIRALCDVGKTTKGKHRKGLIGQKGIGFKSVFRVTDRPQIHSNGFHICFDVNNGPLGMIKPLWIDEEDTILSTAEEKMLNEVSSDGGKDFSTKIVLPFSTQETTKLDAFETKLTQIEPSLLLFLNKLQKIVIHFDTAGTIVDENNVDVAKTKTVVFKKRKLVDNVVCIESAKASQFYLLQTFSVDVPLHLNLKLEETEICFAFPLEKSSDGKTCTFNFRQTQSAFAFLPVRDFGLKFIVQADFEIPSSRQDLDMDSAFNQWLSLQIPQLFLENMNSFVDILQNSVHAAIAFLNFLPLPNETFGYFKPVAQKICELIRSKPIIPTVDGGLCLACEAIQLGENLLSSGFIDTGLFTRATGWKLAHKDLDRLRPAVVKQLGLHTVGINDLLVTLEYICSSQSANLSQNEKMETIKSILLTMTANFSHQLNSACISTLKKTEFVPLAEEEWVSVENNPDLFCNSEQNQVMLRKLTLLKVVDQNLLLEKENKINQDIQKLLVRIGVKVASCRELAKYHVFDVLSKKDTWAKLSHESLCDYTVFLIRAWNDVYNSVDQESIKKFLIDFPVLTRKNEETKIVQASEVGTNLSVYFHHHFEPKIVLMSVFKSTSFRVLHEGYLSYKNTNQGCTSKQAFDFFSRLGVTDFFQFREVKTEIPCEDGSTETCTDFDCELIDILKNTTNNVTRAEYMQLFTIVSHYWRRLSEYLFARISDGKFGTVKLVNSALANALLQSSWVPTVEGTIPTLSVPRDVFVNTSEAKKLFRPADVQLLEANLPINSSPEFVKFLGINLNLTADIVLEYLRKCSQDASFETSLEHMASIYNFLQNNIDDRCEILENEPLFYLPNPRVDGAFHFVTVDHLIMGDHSGLFEKYKQVLNKHKSLSVLNVTMFSSMRPYRLLGPFFEAVGALAEPPPKVYRELMMSLTSSIDMTRIVSKRENRIEDLFLLISLSADQILESDACLPCSNGKLACLADDHLLLPDDQSSIPYTMFESHEDLRIIHSSFLELAPEIQEKIMALIDGRFTYLSEAIQENTIPGQLWTCSVVHKFVYFVTPLVQRYIRKRMNEKYEIRKNLLSKKLQSLSFYACKEIEVIYTYQNVIREKMAKNIFCNGKEFYIGRELLEDWKEISSELASVFSFGDRDNLVLFIDGLVKYFNKEPGCHNVEAFLKRFDIPPIPSSDPKWSVSEPKYSQVAIDLEIRRNTGDTVVTEEDLRAKRETELEMQTKSRVTRGAGQWPPLPPRGYTVGGLSGDSVGYEQSSSAQVAEVPPPPKPPSEWKPEYVVPPRMITAEPNRIIGDSSLNQQMDNSNSPKHSSTPLSQGVQSGSKSDEDGNTLPVSVRGEKRPREATVSGSEQQPNFLSSSPQGSQEKKPRSSDPEIFAENDTAPVVNICNEAGSQASSGTSAGREEGLEGGEKTVAVSTTSSSLNMEVTFPNDTTYFSSVSCQLETLHLSSSGKTQPPSQDDLNQIMAGTSVRGNSSAAEHKAILTGRFGELLVYKQLCETWKGSTEIHWLNETTEQYRPYDICVTHKSTQKIDFIEVKSTSSPQCEVFKISSAELKFATEKGSNYFLFFVFNALDPKPTVTYFSNLQNKLDTNQVSLLLQMHK